MVLNTIDSMVDVTQMRVFCDNNIYEYFLKTIEAVWF